MAARLAAAAVLAASLLSVAAAPAGQEAGGQAPGGQATVDPAADAAAMRAYFHTRFPALSLRDYADGPYALDAGMRKQLQDLMQFPPTTFALEDGAKRFAETFGDGATYATCFPGIGQGIAQDYPRFDAKRGGVETLAMAVNDCRAAHHAAPLPVDGEAMADLLAQIGKLSDGKPMAVTVPDDPHARAVYARGRAVFDDAKRGTVGMSCADCHVAGAGPGPDRATRAPALGITAGFPAYSTGAGRMLTAEARIAGCDRGLHVAPYAGMAADHLAIAYYLAAVSRGVPVAAPGVRP
ncbi:sulfur oxidation c-type cytochrome SoxA [Acidisphaera rubrifaciens]|uniref:L-cysteine S-thiosulfotransferase subunit SoxA n=1 Tax=Acidisphaera rubrifaciens HS-AP3 TaxID=1231350 RepID=A0A0D6P7B0_9PROT|nr:sulfur oxidation c-type cytochrome SoxA [Acidisphaera rubrifaciens]GAN76749.1 sulfur oxidation protein [Acidisphaera rubrifaciens HS-AP3]